MPILKKPAIRKRPAQGQAGVTAVARSKAGVTAVGRSKGGGALTKCDDGGATADGDEDPVDAARHPKARNPFQLFYAHVLRSGKASNASEASGMWGDLPDEQKAQWRQTASLEKKLQVESKPARGVAIRATAAVRAAVSLTVNNDAQSYCREILEPEAPSQRVASDPVLGGYRLEWHNRNSTRGNVAAGAFGVAYRGFCLRTQMQVAVKVYGHDKDCRSELEHEVKIYKRLEECRHGMFLSVLEAGLTAPIPYLVLPWVGDSLSGIMASRITQNPMSHYPIRRRAYRHCTSLRCPAIHAFRRYSAHGH